MPPQDRQSPLLSEATAPWWLGLQGHRPDWGGLPPLGTIEYISKLLILVILLLAFPWLIAKALTDPRALGGHAGGLSMGAASMGS